MNNNKLIGKRHKNGVFTDIIILSDNLSFIPRLSWKLNQIEKKYDVHSDSPEKQEKMYQELLDVQKNLIAELSIREECHGLSYTTTNKHGK